MWTDSHRNKVTECGTAMVEYLSHISSVSSNKKIYLFPAEFAEYEILLTTHLFFIVDNWTPRR